MDMRLQLTYATFAQSDVTVPNSNPNPAHEHIRLNMIIGP